VTEYRSEVTIEVVVGYLRQMGCTCPRPSITFDDGGEKCQVLHMDDCPAEPILEAEAAINDDVVFLGVTGPGPGQESLW
jgi:hypothetical protein